MEQEFKYQWENIVNGCNYQYFYNKFRELNSCLHKTGKISQILLLHILQHRDLIKQRN
jgi:hypothetical protein